MWISEFKTKVKSVFSFSNPQSAICIPHLPKYFSLGQQRILFIFATFVLVILYFRFYHRPLSPPPEETPKEIVVEVSGEVRNPGIHLFQNPPTVREAIDKAGGLKEVALFDTGATLETLETGTLLTILKESSREIKVKLGRMEARKLLAFSLPLDLNRVSAEDLCLIPGIGESLAQEIFAYREKRRGFRSAEELKNVKGIGEKKWTTIKPFFFVEK
jgi:competence protein ComEA